MKRSLIHFRISMAILSAAIAGLGFTIKASAAPSLVAAMGVTNPPANLASTAGPAQVAIADTATLISTAGLQPVLQATLTAQGFSNANNWNMVGNAAPLDNAAVFTVSTYSLSLNPANADYPVAGTAFGETMKFSFAPNLAQPVTPMGSTATLHWLQLLNESSTFATKEGGTGFGYPIAGQTGYWQLDNGDKAGTTAAGATIGAVNGPYYDSNGGPSGPTQVVPNFYDFPNYYDGPAPISTLMRFPRGIFTPPRQPTRTRPTRLISVTTLSPGDSSSCQNRQPVYSLC